jgi:tetratricopeptide (TPR) repeat protein
MRLAPLLLLSGVVGAAAGYAAAMFAAPDTERPSGADDPASARIADLEEALRELRASHETLRAERAGPRAAGVDGVSREPVIEDLVARAVARALAEQAASGAAVSAGETARTDAEPFSADASLAELLDPLLAREDRERLWKEAHEAGKTRELIGLLEARAKADPRNAELQFELANAYLQPITQGEVAGIEAGTWSMKADAAFDAVLALDEDHWDARFGKAVSYSFWPPIFGKQQAAIDHFEILLGKQGGMAPRPEFAQTYLFLGNMYEQTGDAAKARETWNLGLSAFPQDRGLRQRLGLP